jgi:hypothetical protein
VHWTTVNRLLYNEDVDANVRMVKALHNCGDDSEAFNTMVSRLISRRTWDNAVTLFTVRVIQDALHLVALGLITVHTIDEGTGPKWWLRITVMCFALRSLLLPLMDMSLMAYKYGFTEGGNMYWSFWNVFVMGSEVLSALIMGNLLLSPRIAISKNSCSYEDPLKAKCQILVHPVMFSMAIGLKWISFTFETMCAPGFGQTVLPAFYAVVGKDARYFVTFLTVIVAGSYHSYWSLPIPENMPMPKRSHLIYSFLKLFKLDILGDVHMFDFEGVNEQVEITKADSGNFSGSIDDGEESQIYHDAICTLIVVLVSLVSILVMNVAIGVLSEAYYYNKSNANQIWCHYRAGYTGRVLLRRHFWRSIFSCCSSNTCCEPDSTADNDQDQGPTGVFIGCHEVWFLDANDTIESMRNIIGQEKTIAEQITKLVAKVESQQQAKVDSQQAKPRDSEKAEALPQSDYQEQANETQQDKGSQEEGTNDRSPTDAAKPFGCAFLPKSNSRPS